MEQKFQMKNECDTNQGGLNAYEQWRQQKSTQFSLDDYVIDEDKTSQDLDNKEEIPDVPKLQKSKLGSSSSSWPTSSLGNNNSSSIDQDKHHQATHSGDDANKSSDAWSDTDSQDAPEETTMETSSSHYFRRTSSFLGRLFSLSESGRQRTKQRRRSSRMNKNPLLHGSQYSQREYKFMISAGILLAFNGGYVNGGCMSGALTNSGARNGVAGVTSSYTRSTVFLTAGEYAEFGFIMRLVLSFMFGAFLAGLINPHQKPYIIAPTYCPTFLLGSIFLTIASVLAAVNEEGHHFFFFAAAANGLQNGISSLYTKNLIRSTGLTGSTTDIGLFLGQVMRGNYRNLWKLYVLSGLVTSFWLGGVVSYFATQRFQSYSLLFNAGLMFAIAVGLMVFLISNLDISTRQAISGGWTWQNPLTGSYILGGQDMKELMIAEEILSGTAESVEIEEAESTNDAERLFGKLHEQDSDNV